MVVSDGCQVHQDGGLGERAIGMDTVVPEGGLLGRPWRNVVEATEGQEVPNSRPVCATCGRGDAQLLKGGELLRQNDVPTAGVGVGSALALGARFLNLLNWERDSASAMPLSVPCMCCSNSVQLWAAATKNRVLTSCISAACLQVPVRHMSTTAWLSPCTNSCLVFHWGPQVEAAMTTAENSFHCMSRCAWRFVQEPLSH